MRRNIKEEIKNKYVELCVQNKNSNVPVNLLCREVSISKTTFYKYYKNTNEIARYIEDTFIKDLDEITRKHNYTNILDCNNTIPLNFYDLFMHVRDNRNLYNYLFFNEYNPSLLAKGKRIVYDKFKIIYKNNIQDERLLKCIADISFTMLVNYCNMLIKYHDIIDPKGMTLVAKDLISSLILNKNFYFKNK